MVPTFSIESGDGRKQKVAFFAVYPYGSLEIKFESLRRVRPFDSLEMRKELLARLRRAGLDFPTDSLDRRPSVALDDLASPQVMRDFQQAIEWGIATLYGADADQAPRSP
jgi:hypothetical protein